MFGYCIACSKKGRKVSMKTILPGFIHIEPLVGNFISLAQQFNSVGSYAWFWTKIDIPTQDTESAFLSSLSTTGRNAQCLCTSQEDSGVTDQPARWKDQTRLPLPKRRDPQRDDFLTFLSLLLSLLRVDPHKISYLQNKYLQHLCSLFN